MCSDASSNSNTSAFCAMRSGDEDRGMTTLPSCRLHRISTWAGVLPYSPAINQIELHPLLNQAALRATNTEHDIVTEAYGPLGVGRLLDNPTVTSIAGEYGKSPAQVLIRWSLQLGNVVIPRSATPERIVENADVFEFELATEHMDALNGLDEGTRFRPDPATYTGT